ncbi:alpha/beta hydrolase family protein [Nocardiopsis potens]|uniref:alpha/beta hydrolase family protein n=1 Tax=Nocardiopsis potens TaxID=1246458 RepID=UPI00034B5DD5|nr:alpha/beta fold hydrolase [Nocardiopsis potens]
MPWPPLLPARPRPPHRGARRTPLRLAAAAAAAALLAAGCVPGAEQAAPPGVGPVERDVRFASGPDTLYGTFALPPGAEGKVPAALIISGSGPTDRDGNSPGRADAETNLNFARVLADAGVASLRYDKLGSGETGMGSRGADDPVDYDVFEQEMVDAYAELAAQPEVDPSRLLVLGHSEGALFALRAPEAVGGHPPAALVLAAPLGTRYLDLLDRQLTEQMRTAETAGTSEADVTALLSDVRTATARLRAGEPLPEDLSPELDPLFSPQTEPFLREIDALDPLDLARDLPAGTPALVLWGTEDAQVTEAEVDRLTGGLPDAARVDLDGADHVFRMYDPAPGSVATDAERGFSPDAAPALEDFLDTAL